jgi:gliding motility-associated-like protein
MQKISFFFLFSLLLNLTSVFGQVPPSSRLVAHFDFENIGNNTLTDVSGNGSSGILIGDTMTQGCGISGKSLHLDGVTNRIIFFGGINDQFKSGDFSISLYFKPEITGQLQGLLCKGDSCQADKFFDVKIGTIQRYALMNMRENKVTKNSILKGVYGKACWHNLVIAKGQNEIVLYLDGKEAKKIPTNGKYNLTSNAPLTIAEHQCLGNDLVRFKGELDEMYMYSKQLTASEVKQLYTPIDKILTRDTVVYLGRSTFQAFTTKTCADQFEWKPAATISNPAIRNPIITPTETTIYALTFKDNVSGCSTTDSVLVKVIDPDKVGCTEVLLPKAFTPNGDNLNEEYGISNPYAIEKLLSFEIYNRWGSRVFGTDDKFGKWNGEIGGKIGTTDTYIYKIEYECANKKQTISNTFTLMR